MWGWVVAFVFLGYLLPHFLVAALPTQDLKKKARAAHVQLRAHLADAAAVQRELGAGDGRKQWCG